jgi:hypothetical protein
MAAPPQPSALTPADQTSAYLQHLQRTQTAMVQRNVAFAFSRTSYRINCRRGPWSYNPLHALAMRLDMVLY